MCRVLTWQKGRGGSNERDRKGEDQGDVRTVALRIGGGVVASGGQRRSRGEGRRVSRTLCRSRIRQQSAIARGATLHTTGWRLCPAPLAVEPEQGVARQLVHQPERESVHRTRGVANQPAAMMMQMSPMTPEDRFWGKWLVFGGMAEKRAYFSEGEETGMVAAIDAASASPGGGSPQIGTSGHRSAPYPQTTVPASTRTSRKNAGSLQRASKFGPCIGADTSRSMTTSFVSRSRRRKLSRGVTSRIRTRVMFDPSGAACSKRSC